MHQHMIIINIPEYDTCLFLHNVPNIKKGRADNPGSNEKGSLIKYFSIKIAITAINKTVENFCRVETIFISIILYIFLHQKRANKNHIAPIDGIFPNMTLSEIYPQPHIIESIDFFIYDISCFRNAKNTS